MLGRFEEGVLTVALHAARELTATQIHQALEPIFDKASMGGMYVTLDRLERKGMLRRRLGEPTRERGGKAQHFFKIAPEGKKALQEIALLQAAFAAFSRVEVAEPEHPGKLIDGYLCEYGWPVPYAAGCLGVTREHLYVILRGDTGISPSMARALARNGIGGTPLDWLIRQAKYDLAQPESPRTPKRLVRRAPKQ